MLTTMSPGDAGDASDLSSYELARLERIRANRAVLGSLGLKPKPEKPAVKDLEQLKKAARKRAAETAPRVTEPVPGERQSKRLRGVKAARIEIDENERVVKREASPERAVERVTEGGSDEDTSVRRYDSMPLGPEMLDDFEFEAYLVLRKWRLVLCRQLDTEPYKIAQNRTLAEFVRRLRNSPDWGTTAESLLECWGIGPSKAAEGGYAWAMMEQLQKEEAVEKLAESRKSGLGMGVKDEDKEDGVLKEDSDTVAEVKPEDGNTNSEADEAGAVGASLRTK
jgi:hypothetical protein